MKILIDMQGIQTPFSSKRGVGVYIEGIVRELADVAAGHDIQYLFNAEFPDQFFECLDRFAGIVTRQNSHLFAQKIIENYRFASGQQIRVAERFVSAFVETLTPDILFSPNLQEGLDDSALTAFAAGSGDFAQISTLHDMVPMYFEEDYLSDTRTRQWYERKLDDARRCDRIVTVSEASKRDIQRFLGIEPEQVRVVRNGYDPNRFNPSRREGELEEIHRLLGTSTEYILHYGGADKHKNLTRLLHAYARLPRATRLKYPLVLGGRDVATSAEVLQAIAEHRLNEQVLLPGFIPSEMLPAMIRGAALFVFPSTHEGFGLPVVEAMACGTPTIGSNNSGVGEVLGQSAAGFDPFSVQEISERIGSALESGPLRSGLRDHGLARASAFSWRTAAQDLVGLFEEENERRQSRSRLSIIARRVGDEITAGEPGLLHAAALTIAQSVPAERPRRVYVDVSSVALYGGHSGIQRVARELARRLPIPFAERGIEVQVVYAAEGTNILRALSSLHHDGSITPDPAVDAPVDLAASDILLFLDLHPGLAIRMEHQVQCWRSLGVSVFHVVYDILPLLMPERFWPELQEEFYRWLQVVSRSDGLLCISRTVAEQTASYLSSFGVSRSETLKVGYFPLGADFDPVSVRHEPTEDVSSAGDDLSFLMVGTVEPRKAHEQTLLAFEQGWRIGEPWRLTIVGKQGWKMERLGQYIRQHPEFGRRLFWFESASDQLLQKLYHTADCVICPSEGEGFGLPLIEAARVGKPLLARDIPVFREVAGEGASFFPDDQTPSVIASAIANWAMRQRQGHNPEPAGIRAHSWNESAVAVAEALLDPSTWPFSVKPSGALDLRSPATLRSANIELGGFHKHENSFVWTAKNAWIEFETVEAFDAVTLEIQCSSWREMPFNVLVNGTLAFSAIAGTSVTDYRFTVADIRQGTNRIEIECPGAATPPNDQRTLGLAIRHFRIFGRMPVKLGQWVNARDLRVEWQGFSQPHETGRSSEADRSTLNFHLEEAGGPASISIYGCASRLVQASVALNGEAVGTIQLSPDFRTVELTVPCLLKGRNVVAIEVDEGLRKTNDKFQYTILEFKVAVVEQEPASLIPAQFAVGGDGLVTAKVST